MVMFNKNGQGYFDFDFNALSELTNEKFSRFIKESLDSKFIQHIIQEDLENYYSVTIIGIGTVQYHLFHKQTQHINYSNMPIHIVKQVGGYLIENE